MGNKISIRAATKADAAVIAKLTTELGYPVSAEVMRTRLAKILACREQLMIVALAERQVCGWLQAHYTEVIESGARVEIAGLIVTEKMRRRGIGRLLLAYAEDWAAAIHVRAMVVRTNMIRVASHVFYIAQGFAHVKTQ